MRAHDQAFVDAIDTALTNPVGYAQAPEGALDGVRHRTGPDYVIVYPTPGVRDGSAADDDAAELVYQTTIVGRSPDGVRWLVDRIETALATVTVAGRAVTVRQDSTGDVRPDEDVQPPVFYATPTWRVTTVPA